jgi:hypothetical protein
MGIQFPDTVQSEDNSKPKGFSPPPNTSRQAGSVLVQDMQAGDSVFWFNEDRRTSHQPCR